MTALADATTMFGRELRHTVRYPLMLIASIPTAYLHAEGSAMARMLARRVS